MRSCVGNFVRYYLARRKWRRLAMCLLALLVPSIFGAGVVLARAELSRKEAWHYHGGGFVCDLILKREGGKWIVVEPERIQQEDIWDQMEIRCSETLVFVPYAPFRNGFPTGRMAIARRWAAEVRQNGQRTPSGSVTPFEKLDPAELQAAIASLEIYRASPGYSARLANLAEVTREAEREYDQKLAVRTLRSGTHRSVDPWMPGVRWVVASYLNAYWLWAAPLVLLIPAMMTYSVVRSLRDYRRGLCQCGYNREGLAPDAKCPECGTLPTTRVPGQESQEGRRASIAPAEQGSLK